MVARRLLEPDAIRVEQWCEEHWTYSRDPIRRRAALGLSLGLYGLRRLEVVQLRLEDLTNRNRLYVNTVKRGARREIEINHRLAAALRSHAPLPTERTSPLLRNQRGNAFNKDTPSEWMRYVTLLLHQDYGFHCLRHTAAMRLYEVSGDVYAVMHMLGHSTLHQTHRYLQRLRIVDDRGFPHWSNETQSDVPVSLYTPPAPNRRQQR